jgi:DNA replication licensing factor MCM7
MLKDLKNTYPDYKDLKLKCHDFLANFSENGSMKYIEKMQEVADGYNSVLEIFLDDIRSYKNDESFFEMIKVNVPRSVRIFEEVAENLMPASPVNALMQGNPATSGCVGNILNVANRRSEAPVLDNDNINSDQDINPPKSYLRRFRVSMIPEKSSVPQALRCITSDCVGHITVTTGMVSRISDVKPHISVCTYTCEVCGFEVYQEVTGHQFMPLLKCNSPICKENKSGHLQMQLRGSKFHKYQEIRIQELPDQVPIGNIPRTMTIHCFDTQTRKCSPGDVVTIYGILMIKRRSGYKAMVSGLLTDCFIEASKIIKEKSSYEDVSRQNFDVAQTIRDVIANDDPYEVLSKSIAPEIYGHDDIKKALLLQLVGGVSRSLPDGVKIRGDVNICLMGDPGLAKSQLLKYVASIAPRGVYTTGKGSSGVGLTAAVTRDTLTGEMTLEGGALVLADMGICCIDEFDKMNESDRTAIHEVMEVRVLLYLKYLLRHNIAYLSNKLYPSPKQEFIQR